MYTTIADAQLYFNDRLGTIVWDEATDEDKTKALKQSTKLINRLRFIGQKLDPNQVNEFPRLGQSDVPQEVKDATCELALQLLDDIDPNREITNITATDRNYATVQSSYERNFVLPHIRAGIVSSEAWSLLLPYLEDPMNIKLVRS